jgi:hypothetical protein
MKAIVRTCWDICLLRQGPQIFPRSWYLFTAMFAIYILMDAILFLAQGIRGYQIVYQTCFDCALLLMFFAMVLWLWQKPERFNQTAIALFGSSALIMVVAVPVSYAANLPDSIYVQTVAQVLLYGILAWSILVIGHVMRHALDTRLFTGIFIAGAYIVLNFVLYALLFPMKA